MDEIARIAMLARLFAANAPGVETSIGDDAAVLSTGHAGARIVWTIDQQIDGTHFRRDLATWRDIGWRSFMAAASDLAAMGASSWCALSALVLPDDFDDAALEELARGQREAALDVGAPIVGGNLARGPMLSIATTLVGTCDRAVTRKGAVAGDGLWMAGHVGLAAAGLSALEARRADDDALRPAIAAWRTPRALVVEGKAMANVAHAAIDISDGLARDAAHLANSSGVRVAFDELALGSDAQLVAASRSLGVPYLDLALYGGEDYALVIASPCAVTGFRRIGDIEHGDGLVIRGPSGARPVEPRGFDHFAKRPP